MIREDIVPGDVLGALQRHGRVQIPDFLVPGSAERLHICLSQEVPWCLALCDENGARSVSADDYAALSSTDRTALFRTLAESAVNGQYRFVYDAYSMPRAYLERRDPGLLLHALLEFLNTPNYLAFMAALTGEQQIRRVTAQATAYRPGQFLRTHSDIDSKEGRLYAFVLNLSRDWQADWGGLLHFLDAEGAVVDTLMPRWNTMTLFKVPTPHAVSMVMPWAEQERLAITGWLLAN